MLAKWSIQFVDWFIPVELRQGTANLWRARIFVISHLLGPWSAVAILGYLYSATEHDAVFWTICGLCATFWILPGALKLSRAFTHVALFSFCDLAFISIFGSYFYGGVSSPFLPWFLTSLLLGFFYLSDRPLLVLTICAVGLFGFCAAYTYNGSFPERVPLQALSTVGVISISAATIYNSMMAIYYAYVMTAESALRGEVEDHLRTATRLRSAKEAAERANEAKAIFLAKMNHQLRTPLNAIIGYSEILLEEMEEAAPEADADDLRTINNAGRHLLSLVSDVLYMPKIDSDHIEISVGIVDLAACLDEIGRTCRNLITQNGNQFLTEVPRDLGSIETDERRLRQILINLLGNAGKFTKDGTVVLSATRAGRDSAEAVHINVKDTGIGILPDKTSDLFTDFNRANSVTAGSYGGSGLGLAVSHRLARLLDGELSVQSTLGAGSVFTLVLPTKASMLAAAA
jgi:signal transduction histidine kinase